MAVLINLASGPKDIGSEYLNIDGAEWNGFPDGICDITKIPFTIDVRKWQRFSKEWDLFEGNDQKVMVENNFVDKIVFEEALEHISFRDTDKVLAEIYRILKPNGVCHIQVPDCGKSMEYYVNGEICKCCAHKPKSVEDGKGKKGCSICKGKGKIHPNRWLYSFLGAQKHSKDAHLSLFTKRSLEKALQRAGFTNINFKDDEHGWKLKVNVIK